MQASGASAKKATPASAKDVAPKPARRSKSAPKASAEDSLSPAAKKAVAAVEAAAAKLPSKDSLIEGGTVTRMAEGGGGWGGGGGADQEPENYGTKEHPSGHPDCLTKYTFVISGVLDSMFRQAATDYIKRHGGRVTGSVTGKTTFLLCGALFCH